MQRLKLIGLGVLAFVLHGAVRLRYRRETKQERDIRETNNLIECVEYAFEEGRDPEGELLGLVATELCEQLQKGLPPELAARAHEAGSKAVGESFRRMSVAQRAKSNSYSSS
ncbi:MAG TPA: hypothetical protein VLE72_00600 [Candidatus Saccharimonadales bacterium]|nr:hypothetical protein [Candidatus Saccharimonadales bacterium]